MSKSEPWSDCFGQPAADMRIAEIHLRHTVTGAADGHLYQSSQHLTHGCPVALSNGHDLPGLVDQRIPGIAAVVDDIVEGFEDAV
jgi:hypothetical protein